MTTTTTAAAATATATAPTATATTTTTTTTRRQLSHLARALAHSAQARVILVAVGVGAKKQNVAFLLTGGLSPPGPPTLDPGVHILLIFQILYGPYGLYNTHIPNIIWTVRSIYNSTYQKIWTVQPIYS